jgi:hypothetical protein
MKDYKPLGDYIREVNVRNKDLSVTNLLGVSISKEFNALLDSSTSVVYNRDNINDGPCSKLIVINGDPTIVDASVIGVYAADRRRPIICL